MDRKPWSLNVAGWRGNRRRRATRGVKHRMGGADQAREGSGRLILLRNTSAARPTAPSPMSVKLPGSGTATRKNWKFVSSNWAPVLVLKSKYSHDPGPLAQILISLVGVTKSSP
jgi:hypothetical protein